jgi:ribosomal protein S18 acetylase RimI-like enzyme
MGRIAVWPVSEATDIEIRRLGAEDVDAVVEASSLFDFPVDRQQAVLFLGREGHHILIAYVDGSPVGFVSGVETTHPDKGTEMFLYELSVDEGHRRRGIGKALASALAELARERGCYGMWVGTEPDNLGAIATYRSAGAGDVEPFVTLSWTFPVS